MTIPEAVEKLNELELAEFAYGHAMGLLSVDAETVAPKDSRIPRGKTLAYLTNESRKISVGEDALRLVDFLREHRDELDANTKRRLELREKDLKLLLKVPAEELADYATLENDSSAAWHDAKEKSDYSIFMPYLEKLINTTKRFASLVEPDMPVYDWCLDKYEEGLTQKTCDEVFSVLRQRIVPLVDKARSNQFESAITSVHIDKETQRKLAYRIMDIMGINRNRCSLGETEHPFTGDFSKYDVRITTNFKEDNFISSLYSVTHEGGHALYELHIADELMYTSLGTGASMAVHESQSRFFENIIGRSREWCEFLFPELVKLQPELGKFTSHDFFRAVNRVEPSLIRTEADEVTYALHIMVRYELEKAMMSGDIPVKELPDMWNALYKEYLGISSDNDRNGILQDSHWSNGAIGYFPTYALGSAYGAQFLNKMRESVDVSKCEREGNLKPIRDWLNDRIWKYGSAEKPQVIMERTFGGKFDPVYFADYLENKVAEVYGDA